MPTTIIAILIMVLTALIVRALDKRSRSTSSPSSEYREYVGGGGWRNYFAKFAGEQLDAHEACHLEQALLHEAAELCRSRESGRLLGGGDVTVVWHRGLDDGADSAGEYLLKHGAANGIRVERR